MSSWSRGERSRPACGRSVSGGQPNDDENRVVLLMAAVHDGHGRPRSHRKTPWSGTFSGEHELLAVVGDVACGAASEMGDIVEGRAVGEFPPLIAVLVFGLTIVSTVVTLRSPVTRYFPGGSGKVEKLSP